MVERLQNVPEHVSGLQDQARFSHGIKEVDSQPLGAAPGAYDVFPGELASPRSPPDSSGDSREKTEESAELDNRVAALRDYLRRNVNVLPLLLRDYEKEKTNPDIDQSTLERFGWTLIFQGAKVYGLNEALRILEQREIIVPELFTRIMGEFIAPYKDILKPPHTPDS